MFLSSTGSLARACAFSYQLPTLSQGDVTLTFLIQLGNVRGSNRCELEACVVFSLTRFPP